MEMCWHSDHGSSALRKELVRSALEFYSHLLCSLWWQLSYLNILGLISLKPTNLASVLRLEETAIVGRHILKLAENITE